MQRVIFTSIFCFTRQQQCKKFIATFRIMTLCCNYKKHMVSTAKKLCNRCGMNAVRKSVSYTVCCLLYGKCVIKNAHTVDLGLRNFAVRYLFLFYECLSCVLRMQMCESNSGRGVFCRQYWTLTTPWRFTCSQKEYLFPIRAWLFIDTSPIQVVA